MSPNVVSVSPAHLLKFVPHLCTMHSRSAVSHRFPPLPTVPVVDTAVIAAAASAESNAARCARTISANVVAAVSDCDSVLDAKSNPNKEDLFSTVTVSFDSVFTGVVAVSVSVGVVSDCDDVVFTLAVIVGIRAAAIVGRVADTRFVDVDAVGRATTFAAGAFDIANMATTMPQMPSVKNLLLRIIFI